MECARKKASDSLEMNEPMEVVWRSVCMVSGEWCVTMDGIIMMPQWFAESWDSPMLVSKEEGERSSV